MKKTGLIMNTKQKSVLLEIKLVEGNRNV